MSHRRTGMLALVTALAVALSGLPAAPAVAVPSAAQTSADRASVDRAVARLDAARKRSADIAARVEETSAELDRVIAEEDSLQQRVQSRAIAIYRSSDVGYISLLFSAKTVEELTSLWELSVRMDEQEAEDLRALEAARVQAQTWAKSLLTLQADAARAVDAMAGEVAAARKELAKSAAALADYKARIAKAAKAAQQAAAKQAAARKNSSVPQRSGTGAWLTGVASNYSINFAGRGASGAMIGPYSMMVAHKTLPFHTLIEFEYNGKRCVASVEDRGPYTQGRMFDLGPGVIRVLGFSGVHPVRYRIIGR